MINELSKTITLRLQKVGVIQDKFEIYKYGFELLISSLIGISLILIIGYLSNTFFDSLVFLVCFILLRQCTGGYHSKTYLSCNLSFITVYLIFIYYRNYIMFSYEGLIISVIISLLIIFLLAPMEHKNKKMNKEKKTLHKITSRIISFVFLLITLVLYFLKNPTYLVFSYVLLSTSVLLLMGRKGGSWLERFRI